MNITEHINAITEPWNPIQIGTLNDLTLNLALFEGEFKWHSHPNGDELFYIHTGSIRIQCRDHEDIELKAGEFGIVPRDTWHCPLALEPSYVLMIEPENLESIVE